MLKSIGILRLPALVVSVSLVAGWAIHLSEDDTKGQPVTPASERENRSGICQYENLTAEELTKELQETSLVYFPVGSLEFHGPHLPQPW